MLFSEYFQIPEDSDLEFLDISLEKDNRFFLDPYLISIDKTAFSKRAKVKIQEYFSRILDNVKHRDITEMLRISKHIKERNETFLGYSKARIKGNGFSQRDLMEIYYQIVRKNIDTPIIEDIFDCIIFLDKVSNDKISDLITNIILEDLIIFTQGQCLKHNIPLQDFQLKTPIWNAITFSWKSKSVQLPSYKGKPVILVPKHLACDEQYFSTANVYDEFIYKTEKNNYAINGFIRLLKSGTRPDCKAIRRHYPKRKETVVNYVLRNHDQYLRYKKHKLEDNPIEFIEKEKNTKKRKHKQ